MVRPFALEHQQVALDCTQRGRSDIAVFLADLVAHVLLGQVDQQFAQVLQIEQEQIIVIGIFESDVEHAFLGIRQPHQA